MAIPADDESFDAVFHIEAIVHAPNKEAVYAEILRILKPGGIFVGYDWCTTPLYNAEDPTHRAIMENIEYGNALPQTVSGMVVDEALKETGFEFLESRDGFRR